MTVGDILIYLDRQDRRIKEQLEHGQMNDEWRSDLKGRIGMIANLRSHIATIQAAEAAPPADPKASKPKGFNLEAAQSMFTISRMPV